MLTFFCQVIAILNVLLVPIKMNNFLRITCHSMLLTVVTLLGITSRSVASPADKIFTYNQGGFAFSWNFYADKASVINTADNSNIWSGSLMPAFWLMHNQRKLYVKTTVIKDSGFNNNNSIMLYLQAGNIGMGQMVLQKNTWGISISSLRITWFHSAPAIIEMYFGTSAVDVNDEGVQPTWDRPFMPDWSSFGYCVPGAKGGTPQSFFRMWDFGQANIALGSFGPSMGSPYGAAFPRPLYYAGMGSNNGFVCAGSGTIPDAAMSLHIQSTHGCVQYLYREDLWGAPSSLTRVWNDPLHISFGNNSWDAFKQYYNGFAPRQSNTNAAISIWNTWGMWRQKKYAIPPILDFAKLLCNQVLVLDDPWESSQGSGKPNTAVFPQFYSNLDSIRAEGLAPGVWETVAWITDFAAAGLTTSDLLLNKNGKPCKANWSFDPFGSSYYCIDISTANSKKFIRERTIRLMKTLKPKIIKLDFAYGLPSPDMAAPKDAALRGERYSYELFKLIAETAKKVDPGVIIMAYSISPLWLPVIDLVSLDDQGDFWYEAERGHQEWSIWASLLGDKNIAVNASSGYDWPLDEEAILNTAILGPPGAVLATVMDDGSTIPSQYLNRRLAINTWFRKTTLWSPVWFNSHTGNFNASPMLRCWGRREPVGNDSILTALVLREDTKGKNVINNISWSGKWALIAQDDKDIATSQQLAVIPFAGGSISLPYEDKPSSVAMLNMQGSQVATGWAWKGGILTINVTAGQLQQTAGFVIKR